MTSWITICDTCKRDDWAARGMGESDGERLAGLIEPRASAAGLATRRVSCTMGCERACNVIVQGAGKIGYSIGTFEPGEEAAEAIVGFAALHAESETGQVPYKTWPAGVKGHFVSRQLPVPEAPPAEAEK